MNYRIAVVRMLKTHPDGMRSTDIAVKLGVPRTALIKAINQLEQAGIIREYIQREDEDFFIIWKINT